MLLACASPAIGQAEPAASANSASTDDDDRLRILFRKGVAAFQEGKNEEAASILAEAWAIRQTYDVAAALAQAEIQLKRYRDAAEHLQFGLSHFAPVESENTLNQLRAAFVDIKSHIATLKISVAQAGAKVQLDDRQVGVSPLPAPQFVDPGVHTLQAQLNGESATVVVNVEAGREYPVELELTASGKADASSQVSVRPSADTDNHNLVPVIVGGAVAAVGTAGLIAFSFAASSDTDTIERLKLKNGPSGCADGSASPADCSAQLEAVHSHDKNRNLAVASAIVGAVGLVTIPIYWFWPRSQPASDARSSAARSPGVRLRGAVGINRISVFGEF
jgi:hypothetical protein